jgi:hypothetical protein
VSICGKFSVHPCFQEETDFAAVFSSMTSNAQAFMLALQSRSEMAGTKKNPDAVFNASDQFVTSDS